MQIPRSSLLMFAALAFTACENTQLADTGAPTLRIQTAQLVRETEKGATYEIKRNTTDIFVTDPPGVKIDGFHSFSNPNVVTATSPTSTTLNVTCHDRLGTGTFFVSLKALDNAISDFALTIECVHRITTPKNRAVNLTQFFAGTGLVPVAAGVEPTDLAEAINIGAAMHVSAAVLLGASSVSGDGGDIELRCLRQGDGILTVTFQTGSNDYNLRCDAEHDQGGGG